MSKILRVCKSEDLPVLSARDESYVYFIYDKMAIYLGKNYYSDPFCIVEDVPENAIEGMLYITLDGKLKTMLDYNIVEIGSIESEDQKEYLSLAGTVYFMKAESRYLDLQSRTLQLPFQNGTYILTVSAAENLMIDKDTVIRYDPASGKFIIDGNPYVDDTSGLPGLDKYTGVDSSTVKTKVENNQISAIVKISSQGNNILKAYGNGLYASTKDLVSQEDLDLLATTYQNYKTMIEKYMNDLRSELDAAGVNVSEESINEKILKALEEYEPTVHDLLKNYKTIYEQLGMLKQSVAEYTDESILTAKKEILNYLRGIEESWSEFSGNSTSTTQDFFTDEEYDLQYRLLEELRKNILYLREVDGSHTVGISYDIITDNSQFDNVCDIKVLPKLLKVTSDMSSLVGYSYLTVSPEIEENHKYLWKVSDYIPRYNEDLTGKGYTVWDGTTEIKVEDKAHVILVEVDSEEKAIKYGKFIAESRLENPKELEILDVVSAEGSSIGYTELIVNPPLESGNIYMLKKASTIPEFNTILSSDYKEWNGIDEIKMDLYDMTVVCLVECTEDLHRARKVGLFQVDLTNELLKRLRITSSYGSDTFYTKINSISPVLSDKYTYRIKLGTDLIIPKLNTYINTEDWSDWDGSKEIECKFGDKLIIAEVDENIKIKKAGIIIPNINNTLYAYAYYDSILADKDRLSINDKISESNIYYFAYNADEYPDIDQLPYGSEIDLSIYSLLTDDGISVTELTDKISVIEELNSKVYRSCIIDALILYVDQFTTITSLEGTNIGYTSISIDEKSSEDNKFYIKILSLDDQTKFTLNTLIVPNDYISWDGISEIDLSEYIDDTTLFIRVIECTSDDRMLKEGKVIPVIKK